MVSVLIAYTFFNINACCKCTRQGELGACFCTNVKRITQRRSTKNRDTLPDLKTHSRKPQGFVRRQPHCANREKRISRTSIKRASLPEL
jgi:hypothetical protein